MKNSVPFSSVSAGTAYWCVQCTNPDDTCHHHLLWDAFQSGDTFKSEVLFKIKQTYPLFNHWSGKQYLLSDFVHTFTHTKVQMRNSDDVWEVLLSFHCVVLEIKLRPAGLVAGTFSAVPSCKAPKHNFLLWNTGSDTEPKRSSYWLLRNYKLQIISQVCYSLRR